MSEDTGSLIKWLAITHVRCGFCQAAPGAPCTTKAGRLAAFTHSVREKPLRAVFRKGWSLGCLAGASDEGKAEIDALREQMNDLAASLEKRKRAEEDAKDALAAALADAERYKQCALRIYNLFDTLLRHEAEVGHDMTARLFERSVENACRILEAEGIEPVE